MLAKRSLRMKLFLCLLPILSPVCGTAQANDYSYNEKIGRLYFLMGLDAGFAHVKPVVPFEGNSNGFTGNVKAGLSYYFGALVLDGRFGWGVNSVVARRTNGTQVTVNNGSLMFDVSPRLRLGDSFQLGPVFEGRWGQDLSFKPTIAPVLIGEQELKFAMFMGAEALFETSSAKNPVRFGVRFVTDLNIPNRQYYGFQGVLQIGFNLSGASEAPPPMFEPETSSVSTSETTTTTTTSDTERWEIVDPVNEQGMSDPESEGKGIQKEEMSTATEVQDQDFVDFTFLKVHFKTGSDKLQPTSYQMVERVAEFLADHTDEFSTAEIEGHTDDRGDASYNLALSKRRAATLANILVAHGVPKSQVRSRGLGKSQPLAKGASDAARAQNRRVRLKIYDVSRPTVFRNELERIRDLFSLPVRRNPKSQWNSNARTKKTWKKNSKGNYRYKRSRSSGGSSWRSR